MRGSRKFCKKGFNFDKVLLVDKRREYPKKTIYKRAIIGPPAKHHLYGVSLACR